MAELISFLWTNTTQKKVDSEEECENDRGEHEDRERVRADSERDSEGENKVDNDTFKWRKPKIQCQKLQVVEMFLLSMLEWMNKGVFIDMLYSALSWGAESDNTIRGYISSVRGYLTYYVKEKDNLKLRNKWLDWSELSQLKARINEEADNKMKEILLGNEENGILFYNDDTVKLQLGTYKNSKSAGESVRNVPPNLAALLIGEGEECSENIIRGYISSIRGYLTYYVKEKGRIGSLLYLTSSL